MYFLLNNLSQPIDVVLADINDANSSQILRTAAGARSWQSNLAFRRILHHEMQILSIGTSTAKGPGNSYRKDL
jgi:hypothetical protein